MEASGSHIESSLSAREKTIAKLLAWGYTQKEIARQASRTVRSARARRYENVFDLHLALAT